jgi:hypothetical protein
VMFCLSMASPGAALVPGRASRVRASSVQNKE